ncbi:MAG TPA: zinc dependent phospholipase C family protein [Chitinophagaceae bacterium]|nr:zinc dependent phospholipase C family protein [Chitinophagaceae bacterium]
MKWLFVAVLLHCVQAVCAWGFYAHKKINHYAVFLLPPEMMVLYKQHINYLAEHAVDPDKRRYAVREEGPRHYIDMDRYGSYPFRELPRKWEDAVKKFPADTLMQHGIVPWWIQQMLQRLTKAFREKDQQKILKLSAEIGHYIADAHVPLHACSNHNGQLTGQVGIHGFWESRIPELLAEKEWDFLIGKAEYLSAPLQFTWQRVLESAVAADTVLREEKALSAIFPADGRFAFEERNNVVVKQYSVAYTLAYNQRLRNMVERRMRQSVFGVASFWYTAWVNAGQPDLKTLRNTPFSETEAKEIELLNMEWRKGAIRGREHED